MSMDMQLVVLKSSDPKMGLTNENVERFSNTHALLAYVKDYEVFFVMIKQDFYHTKLGRIYLVFLL